MTYYSEWFGAVQASVWRVLDEVAGFVPQAIGAFIVFVVGMIVTGVLTSVVESGLAALKLDSVLDKTGFNRELGKVGVHFNVSKFFGKLTWWFFMLVTILSVISILLGQSVDAFALVTPIFAYVPNVVAAVILLLGAVILGNFLKGVVMTALAGTQLHNGKALGALTWWSVMIFGLGGAFAQLHIAEGLIGTLFTGLIAALALAGGLAFGLGGKDYATHLLSKLRDQVE